MATREDCIRALEEAAKRLEDSPSKTQYESLELTPSASTILRHCGSWNAAKAQAGLETNPSTGSRIGEKPDDVSLPDDRDWTELTPDQRWHYKHRDWNTERTLERRQDLRAWISSFKSESQGCTQCGETDSRCLDFHHLDDKPKKMDVNKMVQNGYSKVAIESEIENCELLCANCHKREHHSPTHWMDCVRKSADVDENEPALHPDLLEDSEAGLTKEERLRVWTYTYQHNRGCQRCGERDPICLESTMTVTTRRWVSVS